MHNPPLTDWKGKHVWIVGASSGIGLALAKALHAQGARVVVSARGEQELERFTRDHPGAQAFACDATDPLQLQSAATEILDEAPLDVAVYCAGRYRATRAVRFDVAEMVRHQEVNYLGALYMLDAVLPSFVMRGRGHVSLVASVAGYRGLPRSLAYGPTKAALINLAESLHLELEPLGIGVSVVNPGFVETKLTAQNDFHMPALITPDEAATATLAGWARGRFEIHYPKRFTWVMKAMSLLPFGMYRRIVRKVTQA